MSNDVSDDLKISVGHEIKPELPNMRVPSWLVMTDTKFSALFADAHALQCHYTAYWAVSNKKCQLEIARSVFMRLDHILSDVVNPCDDTAAGNAYFEDQVVRFNTGVQETLSKILGDDQIHDITFSPATVVGQGPAIILGESVDDFMAGDLPFDFIHKHPVNRRAFDQYCMAMWSRLKLMSENDTLRTKS